MKPALVVLAAGASVRLGTCKALVRFAGESVLEHHLRAGAVFDETPALIVTGKHHHEIAEAAPSGTEVLHNPDWSAGRTGGIRLAHLARPGRALVLAPVDVPLVPRAVFEQLLRAWEEAGEPACGWLAPRYVGPEAELAGRFGHPVLVGPTLLENLSSSGPDLSLRELRAQATQVLSTDTTAEQVLLDLDTPEDLAEIRARYP